MKDEKGKGKKYSHSTTSQQSSSIIQKQFSRSQTQHITFFKYTTFSVVKAFSFFLFLVLLFIDI